MTDKEVASLLVRWVKAQTGIATFKAYENGDEQPLPYITVNCTGVTEVRQHEQFKEYEDAAGGKVKVTPVIEVEWAFSLQAFGTSPLDALRPLRSAAKVPQACEALLPSVIFDVSQVRNVPEFVDERWEPRAQMDVMLRGLTRDGVLIDVIETYSYGFTRT